MEKPPMLDGNKKKKKSVRSIRLRTARDAQWMLARVINEVYWDKLGAKKGQVLGCLLRSFIDSFQIVDFEARINDLEKYVLQNKSQGATGEERS
ncbi:MAG TPA: hypothetical protein VHT73_05075 [Thermodesulfobacteriota bacterium]|nr:hypothetical protein [Thermodesulfobacteriota bacterium]